MSIKFIHKKLSLAFLLFAVSLILGNSTYCQINEDYNISNEIWSRYKLKNDEEKRLEEFKDDDEHLLAKLVLLELINKHRKKHHKQPVKLDIHACRSANKTAQNAARNNYMGHWDLQGRKPYHRYAIDGGQAHVSENASGVFSTDQLDQSLDHMISMMKDNHMLMYKERPPNDGHRKNILDEHHNFVGLGLGYGEKTFCYYEEFVNNYLTNSEIQISKQNVEISFTVPKNYYLTAISISYDSPFKTMSRIAVNTKRSYLDEGKSTVFLWDDDVNCEGENCQYSFKLKDNKIAYIKVMISKKKPKEHIKDSKGSFPVSGWIAYKGLEFD